MAFGNVRIAARLGIGFGIIIMVMVASQVVAVTRVGEVSTRLTQINDLNSVKQRYAINFRGSVHDRSILMRDLVLFKEKADIDRTLGEIEKLAKDYQDSAVKMDAMMAQAAPGSPEHKALADIKSVESKTLPLLDRVVKHASGKGAEANVMAVGDQCVH